MIFFFFFFTKMCLKKKNKTNIVNFLQNMRFFFSKLFFLSTKKMLF